MIDQKYWVCFYWRNRRESVEESASRIQGIANALGEIDPILQQWNFVTSKGMIDPMDIHNREELIEGLLLGRNFSDMPREPIEELGYKIHLTNKIARMDVSIGCYCEWVTNVFILAPIHSLKFPHLCEPGTMTQIMHTLVYHLKPDNGVVWTDEYNDIVHDFGSNEHKPKVRHPHSGWMTYISEGYWPLENLPPGIQTEVIPDHGTLITVVPDQFDAANPEHVAIAKDVMDKMDFS